MLLEDDAALDRRPVDIFAIDTDAPLVRLQITRQEIEQRRFTTAALAEHADKLSIRDFQIDILEDVFGLSIDNIKRFMDVLKADTHILPPIPRQNPA